MRTSGFKYLALGFLALAAVGCQNPAVGSSAAAPAPTVAPGPVVTPPAGIQFVALNNAATPAANYSFDGGIQQARTNVNGGTASPVSMTAASPYYAVATGATWAAGAAAQPVTGIITGWTATNLYLQDKNAGICIYYNGADYNGIQDLVTANKLNLGYRVTITNGTGGSDYYGLLEVSKYGSAGTDAPVVTVVDSTNTTLYYVPVGPAPWTDQSLRMVQYQGTVTLAPSLGDTYTSAKGALNQYYRGSFDPGATQVNSLTQRAFQANSSMVSSLTVNLSKTFYGPLTFVDAWDWNPSAGATTKDPNTTSGYTDNACIVISSSAEIQ